MLVGQGLCYWRLVAFTSLKFIAINKYTVYNYVFFFTFIDFNMHMLFFSSKTLHVQQLGLAQGEPARVQESKDYAIVSVSCLESLWHLERFSSLAESLSMRVGVVYLCMGPMVAYKSIHLFFHCMLDIAGLGRANEWCWTCAYFILLRTIDLLHHSGLYVHGRKALQTQIICFVFIVPLLVINMVRTCAAHDCTRNLCRRVCGLGWERGCSHDGYYGMGGVGRVARRFLWRAQMLDATEHQGYVGLAPLAC